MKKVFMILLVNCIMLSIVFGIGDFYIVNADNFDFTKYDNPSTEAVDFNNAATKISSTILQVIRYVGAGIAVISLMLIAVKYMVGSAGDKADYKKNLVVYAIGGVGMFSAATLVTYLQKLADQKIKLS